MHQFDNIFWKLQVKLTFFPKSSILIKSSVGLCVCVFHSADFIFKDIFLDTAKEEKRFMHELQ